MCFCLSFGRMELVDRPFENMFYVHMLMSEVFDHSPPLPIKVVYGPQCLQIVEERLQSMDRLVHMLLAESPYMDRTVHTF